MYVVKRKEFMEALKNKKLLYMVVFMDVVLKE